MAGKDVVRKTGRKSGKMITKANGKISRSNVSNSDPRPKGIIMDEEERSWAYILSRIYQNLQLHIELLLYKEL